MKKHTNTHGIKTPQTTIKAKRIVLGTDVHAENYRTVRQIDHAAPQPPQKFTPRDFLGWAKKQLDLAEKVYVCYEAGPFGYGLYRELEAMGITCLVVRPQDWDEYHKGVKTDRTDALALAQRLSRYVDGNTKELAVITVPTPQQELSRSQSRFREQLMEHRRRLEAQGRSLMLYYGVRIKGRWWGQAWEDIQPRLKPELVPQVNVIRELLRVMEKELQEATHEIKSAATPQAHGFGALSSEVLKREVLDWDRFKNRRQVASLTGMCPGVRSSGNRSQSGPITKHGNRRLRTALVELAWRCLRYQPEYGPVKKWGPILNNPKATGAARKKAIVALGRKLAIDIWRINTKRTTLEKLNLK